MEAADWRMYDKILVTGAAGFIGFHVARAFLAKGHPVVGLDNVNDYYSPKLKERRLSELSVWPDFSFKHMDLADRKSVDALFAHEAFPVVINLAAQAGVRYSLQNPYAYVDSNVCGFLNVLEGCRRYGCRHLIYASSSSVYGTNARMPFRPSDNVDHPISLYAATKKANELMAHSYAHLYGLAATGLRFFTVYGPWGRPDMAMWLFTKAIFANEPIKLFDHGRVQRDFTYVDDVVEALVRLVPMPPVANGDAPDPSTSRAPWRVHNIGNRNPIAITEVVRLLEEAIGRKAVKVLEPLQPGDVTATYADVTSLEAAVDFRPNTPIEEGIARFVAWYKNYHGLL